MVGSGQIWPNRGLKQLNFFSECSQVSWPCYAEPQYDACCINNSTQLIFNQTFNWKWVYCTGLLCKHTAATSIWMSTITLTRHRTSYNRKVLKRPFDRLNHFYEGVSDMWVNEEPKRACRRLSIGDVIVQFSNLPKNPTLKNINHSVRRPHIFSMFNKQDFHSSLNTALIYSRH